MQRLAFRSREPSSSKPDQNAALPPISRGLISPGGSRWTNRSRRWLGKSRCGEWSRPPEPSPDASGMLVQLLRAATECEFDLVPEPGQVMQRARTSDAKSSNSPPAQGALHAPITLDGLVTARKVKVLTHDLWL